MSKVDVNITEIQRFCMHDGPGIRTVVFFSGCPLRCKWCHNPETQSFAQQIYFDAKKCLLCGACTVCSRGVHHFGNDCHFLERNRCIKCGECTQICPSAALTMVRKTLPVEDVLEEVLRDKAFYGANGGITLSGGEPMAQPEAAIELLKLAKQAGISTAVETCGYFDPKYLPALCENADVLLWDYKDSDDARHMENTGVSQSKILENLHAADALGTKIILRCILIDDINNNQAHFDAIEKLKCSLKNCVGVDFLPCHNMGEAKARMLE